MRQSSRHKIGMLFPALTWLFIQFSMSGVMIGSPADAMQIEICSPFGVQQILIDPKTGEPAVPIIESDCDWCQSFGSAVEISARGDVDWAVLRPGFHFLLSAPPSLHTPLRLVADFQSRAPPHSFELSQI